MFTQSNATIQLQGLNDFIQKPSYQCSEDEIKEGIEKISNVLEKNPNDLLESLNSDPFVACTYMLDDLAQKMEKAACKEKLAILFDKCADKLIELCVYNVDDLNRCINAIPSRTDAILKHILSDKTWVKRIVEAENNSDKTLEEIKNKYPAYHTQFAETYCQTQNTNKY